MSRLLIDRTTNHMCPTLAEDVAFFARHNHSAHTCVNCNRDIPVHYVNWAALCADCRLECTDDSDVSVGRCHYCSAIL